MVAALARRYRAVQIARGDGECVVYDDWKEQFAGAAFSTLSRA
jgi:hypothetical protein